MIRLPNGNCPRCGRPVGSVVYEVDETRSDLASKNYECVSCGEVRGASVSLRTQRRRGSGYLKGSGKGREQEKTTMTQVYKGKPVTDVRDAHDGDEGFDSKKDQVVIRLADGTQKTVNRTEVSEKA